MVESFIELACFYKNILNNEVEKYKIFQWIVNSFGGEGHFRIHCNFDLTIRMFIPATPTLFLFFVTLQTCSFLRNFAISSTYNHLLALCTDIVPYGIQNSVQILPFPRIPSWSKIEPPPISFSHTNNFICPLLTGLFKFPLSLISMKHVTFSKQNHHHTTSNSSWKQNETKLSLFSSQCNH